LNDFENSLSAMDVKSVSVHFERDTSQSMPEVFLDQLHLAADSMLERNFMALSTADEEHWFFPIRREALGQLDIEGAIQSIHYGPAKHMPGIKWSQTGNDEQRVIHLQFCNKGMTVEKKFNFQARSRDMAGGVLDIRIWPNFLFLSNPRLPSASSDRTYYFRIRQKEAWRLEPEVLARVKKPNGELIGLRLFQPCSDNIGWQTSDRFRHGRFYSFAADSGDEQREPVGLYFNGRGLLLFALEPANHVCGSQPVPWRVGVDIGTSTTCVTFLPLIPGVTAKPGVVYFEIQTATMHDRPIYQLVDADNADNPGNENEGAAAVLDFPYRYSKERLLTEHEYFPTQLVTRTEQVSPDFMLAHGLIFPRNAVLDNKDIRSLLVDYPPLPKHEYRVFRLLQDIKWKNRNYRRVFIWHLYKMIVHQAARQGACVKEAAFSFPRAFTPDEVFRYANEVRAVFEQHGEIRVKQSDIISESVAVQNWLSCQNELNDQIVLDVGGGTTDYLGMFGQRPALQASYKLAADCINKYFKVSSVFRKLLRDAVYNTVKLSNDSEEKNRQLEQRYLLDYLFKNLEKELSADEQDRVAVYSQQAFVGLLSMLDENSLYDVGNYLRKTGESESRFSKPLRGFFLTLLLLYGGLAHQAARLLRQHKIHTNNLQILFIGNGSRFCRLLGNDRVVMQPILQHIFASGGSNRNVIVEANVVFCGKTIVSEGLLYASQQKNLDQAPVLEDLEANEYLNSCNIRGKKSSKPGSGASDLEDFVGILDRCLVDGKIGQTKIIPKCEGSLTDELSRLVQDACTRAWEHEKCNAAELNKLLEKAEEARRDGNKYHEAKYKEAVALIEPVFITRLRCLLDAVRQKYAAEPKARLKIRKDHSHDVV